MFLAVLVLFVLFIIYIIKSCVRPKNYPPGPTFLPFFGTALTVPAKGSEFEVEKWIRKYGTIIGHKLGPTYMVFITGYDDIMEGLKHPNFQGRIHSEFFKQRSFHQEMGFFFSGDERWAEVRKFSLRYFGQVFTSKLEELMEIEIADFFATIKSGQVHDINGPFMKMPLNVIMRLLCGCTREEYKKEIDNIQELTETYFTNGRLNGIELVYPQLKIFFGNHYIIKATQATFTFLQCRLTERKENFSKDIINCYMDAFLLQQQKEKESSGNVSYYTDEELLSCALDLIQAGNESTGKTIEFVLLYVSLNPRVQKKIHEEIDRVVGRSRLPKLDDRLNLPYLDAVISETYRVNPIAPLGVLHRVTEDTKFKGYKFTKDTLLYFAHKTWMNDSTLWNNSDQFIPERFIGDDNLKRKLTNFGVGKRSCIGEILVRNTMFLFLASFFQNYSIQLPDGYAKPSTMPVLGVTNGPHPFKLVIKERN